MKTRGGTPGTGSWKIPITSAGPWDLIQGPDEKSRGQEDGSGVLILFSVVHIACGERRGGGHVWMWEGLGCDSNACRLLKDYRAAGWLALLTCWCILSTLH